MPLSNFLHASIPLALIAILQAGPGTHRNANTSVYTTLDEKACKTQKVSDEGSYSEQMCPGQSGFRLKVVDADARMSVSVISPDGQEHPLRFDEVVSPHFSSLGPRAEWRMPRTGNVPLAVTVRLNANEDDANPSKVRSYLVVSRVDAKNTCVVKVLPSDASALDAARNIADHASEMICLKP